MRQETVRPKGDGLLRARCRDPRPLRRKGGTRLQSDDLQDHGEEERRRGPNPQRVHKAVGYCCVNTTFTKVGSPVKNWTLFELHCDAYTSPKSV
jgi:hypothetical protein